MIVGGMAVAAGTRMAWVEVNLRGVPVNTPGIPPIFLGRGAISPSGTDIGAGYLFGLGLLLALIPLGWLVVGPRGREVLGVLGVALAIGIGVGAYSARADSLARAASFVRREIGVEQATFRVKSSAGPAVTGAGAALAALSAMAGAAAGRHVPAIRMPKPPDREAPP
jgi:hypothetical protein